MKTFVFPLVEDSYVVGGPLDRALKHAGSGDAIIYWTGHLAMDCEVLHGGEGHQAAARAAHAWAARQGASIRLFQRRNDDGGFDYLAMKRQVARP